MLCHSWEKLQETRYSKVDKELILAIVRDHKIVVRPQLKEAQLQNPDSFKGLQEKLLAI